MVNFTETYHKMNHHYSLEAQRKRDSKQRVKTYHQQTRNIRLKHTDQMESVVELQVETLFIERD
jgi:hypothetical protein